MWCPFFLFFYFWVGGRNPVLPGKRRSRKLNSKEQRTGKPIGASRKADFAVWLQSSLDLQLHAKKHAKGNKLLQELSESRAGDSTCLNEDGSLLCRGCHSRNLKPWVWAASPCCSSAKEPTTLNLGGEKGGKEDQTLPTPSCFARKEQRACLSKEPKNFT